MHTPPYSLPEAQHICNSFKHLVGQPFGKNNGAVIEHIVIAPFEEENRNRFIMLYLLLNDFDYALEQSRKGTQFDVLAMTGAACCQDLEHRSLHNWLTDNETVAVAANSISASHVAADGSMTFMKAEV